MLINAGQTIGPVNTVTYTIQPKYQFNDKGQYGSLYFDPSKTGMAPSITVKYDESKSSAIRHLCGSKLIFNRPDGTTRSVTVNFTVVHPSDVTDAEVEDAISFHKLVIAVTSFGANFTDRIA